MSNKKSTFGLKISQTQCMFINFSNMGRAKYSSGK